MGVFYGRDKKIAQLIMILTNRHADSAAAR